MGNDRLFAIFGKLDFRDRHLYSQICIVFLLLFPGRTSFKNFAYMLLKKRGKKIDHA